MRHFCGLVPVFTFDKYKNVNYLYSLKKDLKKKICSKEVDSAMFFYVFDACWPHLSVNDFASNRKRSAVGLCALL